MQSFHGIVILYYSKLEFRAFFVGIGSVKHAFPTSQDAHYRALATEARHTLFAPARFRVPAHSVMVLPVVITSSISKKLLPAAPAASLAIKII